MIATVQDIQAHAKRESGNGKAVVAQLRGASKNFGEVQAASVRVLRDLLAAAEAIGDQHGLFV